MKYPLSYTEKGYFATNGKTAHFVRLTEWIHRKDFKIGTWKEFKELYPYTVYDNGSHITYRTKTPHKKKREKIKYR